MEFAQQPLPSRRFAGLAVVLLLHGVLIYALATGLGRQAVEVLRKPLETRIIEEIKPPPPPERTLPPPPKLEAPPPPYIPPPEVVVRTPPPKAIAAVTTVKPAEPSPPPVVREAPVVRAAVRVPPVIDAARSCRQPEYPAVSRRLEETGAVILQFLIDVDGSVLQSKVDSSSGHSRLDEAAIAALSKCRFKAGSVDGVPEQSWAKIRYVWKLD
ncbi:energy transducer TonB [Telmatospirillum siberiense]|uniref:Energy transducer TonB n=1 Tax=Telmatospirillum siberiense TaxID=382514 RepID=A0A2N3PQ32_9PROT|nr:energy transducer TonB [Telmatospirillum siberiense]PKU22510.1 energy transducer TonB [Telmatospirillum siberiense]